MKAEEIFISEKAEFINTITITDSISEDVLKEIFEEYYSIKQNNEISKAKEEIEFLKVDNDVLRQDWKVMNNQIKEQQEEISTLTRNWQTEIDNSMSKDGEIMRLTDELKADKHKIAKMEDAIKTSLNIKDLWTCDSSKHPSHDGECIALSLMYDKLNQSLKH